MTQAKFQQNMTQALQEKSILEQAKQYAFDYLDGVSDRRVSPEADALAGAITGGAIFMGVEGCPDMADEQFESAT